MINKLNAFRQKHVITTIEKKYERAIKRSMQLCPMKPLTKGQEADIKEYFKKHFGREVPTYWHQYLYSRNGLYSEKYIPASIYNSELLYRLNNRRFGLPYADKGFYDTLFPNNNRPRTLIKNMNGCFFDSCNPITEIEAEEICKNVQSVVIKPTLEGHWGIGVKIFHTEDGFIPELNMSLHDLFIQYKKNYIIQEKLEQHSDIAKLNPSSVNTIRVLSYRTVEKEIKVLYAVLRIGRKGKEVDNETAGGIKADINLQTGRINGDAFGNPKEKTMPKTDAGVILNEYLIPSFPLVLDFVKELHERLPYFNLIGWDIAVDKEGKPVLIEWNRAAELSQVAHGPAFGEFTEEILSIVKREKNTLFIN